MSNTFQALEPALANRGPVYQLGAGAGETGIWELIENDENDQAGNTPMGDLSATLAMNGSRTSWAGNVGFNDAHVEFYNRPDPETIIWNFKDLQDDNQNQPDNIFMNEDDQSRVVENPPTENVQLSGVDSNLNAYLTQYYRVNSAGGMEGISPYYD